MIEINETKPVEASLTIVLRDNDIEDFKSLVADARYGTGIEAFVAGKIWEAINS